jgi:hypothetical protein
MRKIYTSSLAKFAILYTFVLRAEIATIFGPNVVTISAAIQKYDKICGFAKFFKLVKNGNCLFA